MTKIKICGLTREADVDAAVAAGADAIGFVFYAKSPRYVSPARAAELARRLPPFVMPVGLFVNASDAELAEGVKALPNMLLAPPVSMVTTDGRAMSRIFWMSSGAPCSQAAKVGLASSPLRVIARPIRSVWG